MKTNPPPLKNKVNSRDAVLLLGAGPVRPQDIDAFLGIAPFVVAADGGASHALNHGTALEYVIGDFDSLPQLARDVLPPARQIQITEQDSTDFEKCLGTIEAPLILALGFSGGRVDHELAVYNALIRHEDKRCIVVGADDIVMQAPRHLKLDLPEGTRVSLFPMAPVFGRSTGLRWPIDGIAFAPDGRVGTSNAATGAVELTFDGAGMLLILPRDSLPVLLDALDEGDG